MPLRISISSSKLRSPTAQQHSYGIQGIVSASAALVAKAGNKILDVARKNRLRTGHWYRDEKTMENAQQELSEEQDPAIEKYGDPIHLFVVLFDHNSNDIEVHQVLQLISDLGGSVVKRYGLAKFDILVLLSKPQARLVKSSSCVADIQQYS